MRTITLSLIVPTALLQRLIKGVESLAERYCPARTLVYLDQETSGTQLRSVLLASSESNDELRGTQRRSVPLIVVLCITVQLLSHKINKLVHFNLKLLVFKICWLFILCRGIRCLKYRNCTLPYFHLARSSFGLES